MNAALENTEEVVNGKVTNSYGDAFVRGNNSKWHTFVQLEAPCLSLSFNRNILLIFYPYMLPVLYITRQ